MASNATCIRQVTSVPLEQTGSSKLLPVSTLPQLIQTVWISIGVSLLLLITFAASLFALDYHHELGEGNEVTSYYGAGILIGGMPSQLAFLVRCVHLRAWLSVVPHVLFALGCLLVFIGMR